jgi:hypothetical protein
MTQDWRISIMKRGYQKLTLVVAGWLLGFCLSGGQTQAATVTQLDLTGGSVSLNFGSLGSITGDFNADGQLLMNQFQPPPNIFEPITIAHLTFSILTSSGGALNLPAPTAETSGRP